MRGTPAKALADSLEKRQRDGRTGEAPPSAVSPVPLPSQEARAAAKLNEQLPFTEPVGLHHLTERFVSWGPSRKEKVETCQTLGPVKIVPTIPFHWALMMGWGRGGSQRKWGQQPGWPSPSSPDM